MFRSRKQNTSRPPSMHVDDFIAMENSASPSDNQNKQPIKVCLSSRSDVSENEVNLIYASVDPESLLSDVLT